jgi:hypothetical protein
MPPYPGCFADEWETKGHTEKGLWKLLKTKRRGIRYLTIEFVENTETEQRRVGW